MKMICLDVPLPDANHEQFSAHLLDEVVHAWKLYKGEFIRDIYFRKDRPGVAIIAECDSMEEARQVLLDFPLAKFGFIDWDIIPLGPFLGWENLFKPS
ncbi:superoxide dismutase [Pseudomonas koreensis]|uniref:Superoxide dismutase n=1 Tax=Pseudomonas koreensis TaxID=198620 RepID=A0A9X2XE75_9PSED|nr:superoxide dismutase [Pseudomonas koreensis]MCU7246899.1 superoxide dismutase [Pseudomonas koreensis]